MNSIYREEHISDWYTKTPETLMGAAEHYRILRDRINAFQKITVKILPIYRWFGELLARWFGFSRNW